MFSGKFWVTGAVTVGLVGIAPAALAQADPIVITPGQAQEKTTSYVSAAPTRMFNVEKGLTLAPGENRFGANLQMGGLGIGGSPMNVAGGVNLRADMGVSPGLETGIAVTGIGAGGVQNLLGNIQLGGKLALTEFSVGMTPVYVGGLAQIGAFATGGGIGNANIGVGIPMTAVPGDRVNFTVTPGLAFGFGAGGLLPGGTPAQVNTAGLTPALGVGVDVMLTDRLSGIVDGKIGFGGLPASGALGVRYGINEDLAADLFVGYMGNPLQAVNSGTVGLGGYYAF